MGAGSALSGVDTSVGSTERSCGGPTAPATMLSWAEPVLRSARALDAREPLSEEGAQEVGLLVGQGVSRLVDHGERGVRIVVEEVGGGGIADRRVQPPRHDHG